MRVVDTIFLFAYVLLVAGGVLQVKLNEVFAYTDEVIAILLGTAATCFVVSRRRCLDDENRKIVIWLSIFIATGIVSTALCGVDRQLKSIAIDLFTCVKFFIVLISVNLLTESHADDVLKLCAGFSRFYLSVMFLFLPVSLVFDTGMVTGERLGYAFLYGHPSNFAAAVITCLVVILAERKSVNVFTVIATLLLIASDRSKAIAFAAVAVYVVFFIRKDDRIPIGFWLVSCLGSLLIAFDQIKLYFFDLATARSVLLLSSFKVASRFCPLGSGFATYGSNVTIADYSPLYYDLGFEKVWGLSPINNDYIADSFWPIVIGQFGYIGLIAFIVLLMCFIKKAIVAVKFNASPIWPICLAIVYLLIASTSESAFFSAYASGFAMSIALIMNIHRK